MKKVYMFLMISFTFLNCTEQNKDYLQSYNEEKVTNSITKLEYSYEEGNTKIETDSTYLTVKNEFQASEEYLATIKQIGVNRNLSRNVIKSVSSLVGERVGVIAGYNSPTGGYDVLEVFMDCEDNSNANSQSGWIGGIVVDRNVKFKFCLVPKSLFSNYKYAQYAVLSLDYGYKNMIERFFDNQDGSNTNYTKLNGTILDSNGIYDQLGNGIIQNKNTTLCFYVYDQDTQTGMESFPDLGISYGVFGSTAESGVNGRSKGSILIDDEDTNNANKCWYWWDFITIDSPRYKDIKNIIVPDKNTRLFMYQAR